MFHEVLFPPIDQDADGKLAQAFQLRRLKRYIPEPQMRFRETNLIVFDLETTGLDFEADRIIEIGAVRLNGLRAEAQFSSLVSTDIELTDDIVKLTGINAEMLHNQPRIDEVLPRFLEFIDGAVLVAHNAEFDLGMIKAAASRLGIDIEWPCFCTLKMARELLPDLENKKLGTLAEHYGLTFEARHRSIGDAKVTVGVLAGLLGKEGLPLQTWSQLQPFTVG
jgi:DNA polymerase III epsilon subunit family exonuclease